MLKLVTLPGSKASLASTLAGYLPAEGFRYTWETHAGTAAMTANVFSGLGVEKMYATEWDVGMYSLLKCCKKRPLELIADLLETEYAPEEFETALEQKENEYKCMTEMDIAVAKYILLTQSYNGLGTTYRDIDKGADDDMMCWKAAQWHRNKYQRAIFGLHDYSECIQNLKIRNADMLTVFDDFAAESDMFIFSDIPYTNSLRSKKLYEVDTTDQWHKEFAKKLAQMTRDGSLKAQMMLCNYVSEDLQADIYCKELLKEGWTLYMVKDTYRPTIIKDNSKARKKNKAVEVVFLNYEPISPAVGEERIFTYEKVFGTEK